MRKAASAVMLLILMAALAFCQDDPEALKARITALEAQVAKLQAELDASRQETKEVRQRNGEFVLEIARLKKLCQEAGIQTDPGAAKVLPGTPRGSAMRQTPSSTAQGLSFYEIRRRMLAMTEAQWKTYAASLEGTTVMWQGWVEDVNKKLLGGYELWVDMDPPTEEWSVQDVTFDIPDALALKLNKDQRVVFQGRIKSAMNILGACSIGLQDAKVLEYATPRPGR